MSINKLCPNCKSSKYIETISLEYCASCGLKCDYWGNGANDIYQNMMNENFDIEEQTRNEQDNEYS